MCKATFLVLFSLFCRSPLVSSPLFLSLSLCAFSSPVIIKPRLTIVSVATAPPPPHLSSFAFSSTSADSVPYLCPHPSICALFLFFFCFEGAGGRPVIRISFLCSFTRSFHSSLWLFSLPLLKGWSWRPCLRKGCSNERERAKMEKGGERDQERKHAEGVPGELWCMLRTRTIRS